MASSSWHLRQKKERLSREISANLDFLSGSVTSQGPRGGWSLTFKEEGKTRTKYIRTSMVDEVRRMARVDSSHNVAAYVHGLSR